MDIPSCHNDTLFFFSSFILLPMAFAPPFIFCCWMLCVCVFFGRIVMWWCLRVWYTLHIDHNAFDDGFLFCCPFCWVLLLNIRSQTMPESIIRKAKAGCGAKLICHFAYVHARCSLTGNKRINQWYHLNNRYCFANGEILVVLPLLLLLLYLFVVWCCVVASMELEPATKTGSGVRWQWN